MKLKLVLSKSFAKKRELRKKNSQRPLMLERLEARQVFASDLSDFALFCDTENDNLLDDFAYFEESQSKQVQNSPRSVWFNESQTLDALSNASRNVRNEELSSRHTRSNPYDRSGRLQLAIAEHESPTIVAFPTAHRVDFVRMGETFLGSLNRFQNDRNTGQSSYIISPSTNAGPIQAEGESSNTISSVSTSGNFYLPTAILFVTLPNSNSGRSINIPIANDSHFSSIVEAPSAQSALHVDPSSSSRSENQINTPRAQTIGENAVLRGESQSPISILSFLNASNRSSTPNTSTLSPLQGDNSFSSVATSLLRSTRDIALAFTPSMTTTAQVSSAVLSTTEALSKAIIVSPENLDFARSGRSTVKADLEATNSIRTSEISTPAPRGMKALGLYESTLENQVARPNQPTSRSENRSLLERIAAPYRQHDSIEDSDSGPRQVAKNLPLPIPEKMVYLDWTEHTIAGESYEASALTDTHYAIAGINPLGVLQIFINAQESGDSNARSRTGNTGDTEPSLKPIASSDSIQTDWSSERLVAYSVAGGIIAFATIASKRKIDESESEQMIAIIKKPR